MYHRETILFDRTSELAPGRSLVQEVAWDGGVAEDLKVEVRDQDGNVLLDYQPEPINLDESQELATEPGSPSGPAGIMHSLTICPLLPSRNQQSQWIKQVEQDARAVGKGESPSIC